MSTLLTKSQAARLALQRMYQDEPVPGGTTTAARAFIGSDKTPGDAARNTKRSLRKPSSRK